MSSNLISNQSVLAFDGQDDYLVIPNQDAINFDQNQNFCIELWLKVGTIEPGSNTIFDINIIEKWQGSAFPYSIRYSSTKGTVYGSRYDGKNPSLSSKIVVNDQKFHHVAFVKQDSQLFLYIDGIEQSQTQDTTIQSTQNASPLYVAAGTSISKGGGTRRFFAGQIADIRLWNIARTPEEIQQNMNSRMLGNEPGLVGYYPLNGDANDKTSNANHGTINGAIWQQEELPLTLESVIILTPSLTTNMPNQVSVLQFDGQDDCVNLGKKSAFKIEKDITIEAWIYAEVQKEYAGILSNIFDTGLTESGYGLLLDGKSGIYLGLEPSSQSQQHMPYLSSGVNTLNLNQWHHVAGIYNGEQMKVYIDGVEKATLAVSSPAIKYEPENDLLIGMFKDDNECYAFKGKIAEIRLWNRIRSAEEIKADMNRYLVGNEAGLVGYWSLNEGSGNIVTDKTSQGNNGTINGAIWQQEELPLSPTAPNSVEANKGVLSFDGKGDYVEVANCPNPTESMTISCWAKSNTPTWNEHGFLVSKRDAFILHPNAGGKSIHFYIASNGWRATAVDPKIDITQWHHYAGTFDGKSIRLYIDGEEVARTDYVGTIQQDNGPMFIGWDDGINGRYFNGQITEVSLWNYARREQEIKGDMYQRLKGNETGLVGYWSLNEGSGSIAPDKTSSGKNGTINGATWQQEELPLKIEKTDTIQSVLTFDGKDDYVEVPYTQSLNPNVFTVSAWVKVVGSQGTWRSVITSRDASPLSKGYIIYAGDNNKWQAWVGNNTQAWEVVAGSDVILNTWTHVTSTFDGKQLKLYVNGTEVGSKNVVYTLNTRCPLRIGAGSTEVKPQYFYPGQIAEVGVWNKALTQTEIQANMNQRLTGKEEGLVAYFPLNEGSSAIAYDKTSNANHGKINGATWQQEELPIKIEKTDTVQSVLTFDGKDDYIKLPDGILTASYTKEAWIKLAEPPAQFNNIISGIHHALFVPSGVSAGHNGQFLTVNAPQPCPKNTWLHVAVAYDSQTRIMCLYQNGQLVSQASNVAPFDPSDRTLNIGVHQGNSFFKGEIAEARIWNFARAQGMIQETMSYRLTGKETGLVAYFPLNDGSGNVATDKTSNANHGTINGATWQQEELPIKDVTSSENESNVITGGNTPTKYGIADSASNFYLVDTNNPINGNGELTKWEIWAENTLPAQLIIYRKEADIWLVVGQSELKTPVVGLNQFSLSEPIKVNKGDFVGIYHPKAGCVSFFKEESAAWAIGNLSGTFLFTGSGSNSTAFANSGNRIYSLRVTGNLEVATEPQVSKFVKVGTKGGSISGTDFELLPQDTAPKSRLKSILMDAAWAIGTLQIEYENIDSIPAETYRSAIVGSGGSNVEVSIQPGDYLTKISGTWGRQAPGYPKEEIITLQFETKKGIKSQIFGGGSGNTEVESFVLEAPEGQEIIGFFGSHGGRQNLLVRLGIYCRPISIPENQQPTEPVQPTESAVIPENQQPTEPVQPTESAVVPKNRQPSQASLKLRKGFSFDEAILMANFSKYAYDVFQDEDGSVDDVALKKLYKALDKNQEWELVHIFRNDSTNLRGLILKNTQSEVAHQYAISLRGTAGISDGAVEMNNIVSDVDWELINYGAFSVQRAKVVQGLHLAFESVADEIQYFFKTLRGELKLSDFRRLRQLPPLRKFPCIMALCDAGAILLGAEFEKQAQDLVKKVVADEELEKILQFLEEQLLSQLSPLIEPIEVWVTGFSLGAALSQLAGLSLRRWFGSASAGGLLIKVYAIAAPKIGNQQFVDFYNQQIGAELSYRIENVLDIVPTYPYDPPFPISAIAPEGLQLGDIFFGKYANGGEPITVVGFGDGLSTSVSFGGLFSMPFNVPFPHSTDTYIKLLEEQKQFWYHLVNPVKDFLSPFLLELLREKQRKYIN
ncbi:LamG-like jellyroll fold domain-containing protein [Anabaena sp. PCC 7108]|uniref:LamG-like jellyroll fold domain-containing protein n=1 Tax=Anabaena sp. PCC 7108 TaxID=163908 RepID=UPI00037A3228|nr:LamG-like jellyroll fold domain-containing protein [Anabaena sp. PCC 7108]